jgi:membrane protein implicated in regulation of membrane protease activity
MIQTPGLLLSLVLASIYAAAFYLLLGQGPRDMLFFWLAALVGFASGHLVGELWDFIPWTLGQVHIIEASVLTILFLLLARWLRQEKKPDDQSTK